MDRITIVDNEFCTSWCYPTMKLMRHQFHKYCYGEDFRNIMIKSTEAYEEHKCIKWLSDDRDFGPIHPDDEEWGKAHWLPRILKAGWKYYAMVLPVGVIGQMKMTQMVDYFAEQGVEAKIFSNPDEAMAWLESKGTLGIGIALPKP